MKVIITFKTPDALDWATEDMSASDKSKVKRAAKKYVQYGEYVDIELDTETGEAKVLPV